MRNEVTPRPSSESIFSFLVPVAALIGKSVTNFMRIYQYNIIYTNAERKRSSWNCFPFDLRPVLSQMKLAVSAVTSPQSLNPLHLCWSLPVLYWDGFPAKLTAKESLHPSFAEPLCVPSCRDEFCGPQCEFCSVSASCDPAMVLRGRRQKPVYPSVVPFRSYSSLNLHQVPNCDFYLYSPSGSSSSKPQTTAQTGNHLLYITGTVTRQWRHACSQ